MKGEEVMKYKDEEMQEWMEKVGEAIQEEQIEQSKLIIV